MRLARAILLRLLYGLLSLLFVSLVTFVADEIAPGDAVTVIAGDKASPETKARIREKFGLNDPPVERYFRFLAGAVRLDFGDSFHGVQEPVIDIIKRNLPNTVRVALMAILLAAIVGITLGTLAAVYENRAADRAVLTLSTLGVTLPNFVLAPILVYIFAIQLDVLPQNWSVNRVAGDIYYLILPVVILSARPMATLTRLTRASMVETLKQEFIKLAIAKGVSPTRLVLQHALRNAILPVITAIGTSFGFLLTGSFVVERYFTMPGIGREAIEAIQASNTPVIQACILITGVMFIGVNLLVDILLPLLDPRIRESQV